MRDPGKPTPVRRAACTRLQAAALPVVNQIVMQSGLNATCSSVVITGEASKGLYDAVATLSDGSSLKIQIQLKGQQILVNVPPQ